jgi:hypothetical protein
MRDRTNERWSEKQKEWLGYRRKIANFKKTNVSLSKAPWEKEVEQTKEDKEKN